MTSQEIYDRFNALQQKSLFTIQGNVEGEWLKEGIIIKPDFITGMGLKALQEEFRVMIDSDGLILRD